MKWGWMIADGGNRRTHITDLTKISKATGDRVFTCVRDSALTDQHQYRRRDHGQVMKVGRSNPDQGGLELLKPPLRRTNEPGLVFIELQSVWSHPAQDVIDLCTPKHELHYGHRILETSSGNKPAYRQQTYAGRDHGCWWVALNRGSQPEVIYHLLFVFASAMWVSLFIRTLRLVGQ